MERLTGKRKVTNLRRLFLKFTLCFCGGTLGALLICWIGITFLAERGVIVAANAAEQELESLRESLESGGEIKNQLPGGCSYGVFGADGTYLEGSLADQGAVEVWRDVKAGKNTAGGWYYKLFPREDNSTVIVLYRLFASFANPWLQKYFPPPEVSCILLFLLLFFLFVALLTKVFGKHIALEIKLLQDMTGQIQEENLEFTGRLSDIQEIRSTQEALLKLKSRLKESLETQWNMENDRKQQVAALGHDLKTPLTILRGDAELLGETALDEEQQGYQEGILDYAKQMQGYLNILQEVNISSAGLSYTPESVPLLSFWEEISKEAQGLGRVKGVLTESKTELAGEQDTMVMDENLMHRALSNIISNAVEYTPMYSLVRLTLRKETRQGSLEFIIEDSGPGFAEEDRKKALCQFYQGDKSRGQKGHYGLGLYIAHTIIQLHGGRIEIENSAYLPGAKVIVRFP